MPTQVRIHPTAKIAATTLICSLAIVSLIIGSKRLLHMGLDSPAHSTGNDSVVQPSPNSSNARLSSALSPATQLPAFDVFVPTIDLAVQDASLEANWSTALASALSGQLEVPVESGRVDVLTEHYAIEVDRWDKWHEAIGQAAHYSLRTNRVGIAAIIVPAELWPPSPTVRSRLLLMDETCVKQEVKLVLLRRIVDQKN